MSYVDGTSVNAGVTAKNTLAREHPHRLIYCYFDASSLTSKVGFEGWVIFYLAGQEVFRVPACLIPLTNNRIGFANYSFGWQDNKTGGPSVLFWNNGDGLDLDYAVHPFYCKVEADEVRFEQNQSTTGTRLLLATLSLSSFGAN